VLIPLFTILINLASMVEGFRTMTAPSAAHIHTLLTEQPNQARPIKFTVGRLPDNDEALSLYKELQPLTNDEMVIG
jgi:hypothetical protein